MFPSYGLGRVIPKSGFVGCVSSRFWESLQVWSLRLNGADFAGSFVIWC